jgi:hypothetical protein
LSVAGVLTVIAVILPIVGSTATADAAVVVSATKATLAARTAHLDLSATVTADGQTVTLTGSGDVDFSQPAATLTIGGSLAGQSASFSEIVIGTTTYEQIPQLSTIEPGKSWISADLGAFEKSASAQSPLSNVDPAYTLGLLDQQGAAVTSLGTSTVGGVYCNGYEVNISNAQIQSELQKLPSWMQQSVAQLNFSGITLDVYVAVGSNELHRIAISTQVGANGHTVGVNIDEDFSQYGEAVSIAAPPDYEVVSLTQFLQDAGVGSTP